MYEKSLLKMYINVNKENVVQRISDVLLARNTVKSGIFEMPKNVSQHLLFYNKENIIQRRDNIS